MRALLRYTSIYDFLYHGAADENSKNALCTPVRLPFESHDIESEECCNLIKEKNSCKFLKNNSSKDVKYFLECIEIIFRMLTFRLKYNLIKFILFSFNISLKAQNPIKMK